MYVPSNILTGELNISYLQAYSCRLDSFDYVLKLESFLIPVFLMYNTPVDIKRYFLQYQYTFDYNTIFFGILYECHDCQTYIWLSIIGPHWPPRGGLPWNFSSGLLTKITCSEVGLALICIVVRFFVGVNSWVERPLNIAHN